MKSLKLLRKAAALSALPLLLALATTQVGCIGHGGPSAMAQGQAFQSGDATYDDFFSSVHDLSVEMAQAPKDEKQIRIDLGKKLDVEADEDDDAAPQPTASNTPATASVSTDAASGQPDPTDAYKQQLKQSAINAIPGGAQVNALNKDYEQAKQTVNQFKSLFGGGGSAAPAQNAQPAPAPVAKGPKAPSAALLAGAVKKHADKYDVKLKLDVDESADDGDGKVTMRIAGDNSDGKSLADQVESAAKDELAMLVKMQKAKKKLEKLGALAVALEANVDTTFRKSRGTASDVKKNLADSKALIKLMDDRADQISSKAHQLISKLTDVANADLGAPAETATTSAVAENDAAKSDEPKKDEASETKTEPKSDASEKAEKTAKAKPAKPEKHAKKAAHRAPAAPKPQTAMADFEP